MRIIMEILIAECLRLYHVPGCRCHLWVRRRGGSSDGQKWHCQSWLNFGHAAKEYRTSNFGQMHAMRQAQGACQGLDARCILFGRASAPPMLPCLPHPERPPSCLVGPEEGFAVETSYFCLSVNRSRSLVNTYIVLESFLGLNVFL